VEKLVAHLRELLAEGATLAEAARLTGLDRSRVYRLAVRHDLPRRRRAMADSKRRALIALLSDGRLSLGRIARRLGVSKSTVSLYANRKLRQEDFAHRRLRVARLCPDCRGRVFLWPCLACSCKTAEPSACEVSLSS